MQHTSRHELVWTTPYMPARSRTTDWYWTIATIAIAVAVIAGYFGNFLFALIAVLATFTILMEASKHRGGEKVMVIAKGIQVGKTLYPAKSISSFHINEEANPTHLSLKLNRPLVPIIEIPLGDMDPELLRGFLEKYIPEEEHEERLTDVIVKSLGL